MSKKNSYKSPWADQPAFKIEDVGRLLKQLADARDSSAGKESLYLSEVVNSYCEKINAYQAFEELVLRRAKLNDKDGRVKRFVDEGLGAIRDAVHKGNGESFAMLFVYHGVAAELMKQKPVDEPAPEAPAQPEEATEGEPEPN